MAFWEAGGAQAVPAPTHPQCPDASQIPLQHSTAVPHDEPWRAQHPLVPHAHWAGVVVVVVGPEVVVVVLTTGGAHRSVAFFGVTAR